MSPTQQKSFDKNLRNDRIVKKSLFWYLQEGGRNVILYLQQTPYICLRKLLPGYLRLSVFYTSLDLVNLEERRGYLSLNLFWCLQEGGRNVILYLQQTPYICLRKLLPGNLRLAVFYTDFKYVIFGFGEP